MSAQPHKFTAAKRRSVDDDSTKEAGKFGECSIVANTATVNNHLYSMTIHALDVVVVAAVGAGLVRALA
jgi:hypothetical protein